MSFFAFEHHDHGDCVARTLCDVEKKCTRDGLRMTGVRRRVLEILLTAHRAMAAYDILARLSAEGLGSQPPLVYRALDFLVLHGFAHKIQQRNAYIACSHSAISHQPLFFICRQCDAIAEEAVETQNLEQIMGADKGFIFEGCVIEISGLCPDCAHQS